MCRIIRNEFNDMSRAGSYTLAACLTLNIIDLSYAIDDMNGIKRTGLNAASVSEASISAFLGAAARYICHNRAVFYAAVIVIASGLFAGSGAFYESNLLSTLFCSYAHDLANLGSYRSATDRTSVNGSLALDDCCSQSGASCVAAATAVVSG